MKGCSVSSCSNRHKGRGYCNKHLIRLRKFGSADPEGHYELAGSATEALHMRSIREGGCVTWTGHLTADGYGRIRADGSVWYVHRYVWSAVNGDIPDGMKVDHACHNRACFAIDHLRLATDVQNAANRSGPRSGGSSGRRGVHWHTRLGRWYAYAGKRYLGLYDDREEAAAVAARAREEMYGEFAGRG